MKTLFRLAIVISIAILLAIWSPWYKWDLSLSNLLGYTPPEQFSGLMVNSLSGELTVFFDDRELGTVNVQDSPLQEVKVEPGLHKVRLVKTSDPPGFYEEVNKVINFEAGVDVIMTYDLGPSALFTESHIFTAQQKQIKSPTELRINTTPATASVFIDDIATEDKLITDLDLSQQHRIKVSADGYETLEFIILPDKQEDRDNLANYDLQLEVNLSLIPLQVISE
jgi:hypothetical protein